jgi:hypothetical protein
MVRTNVCVWVGADVPDAVTVTLYVVDCPCGVLLNDVPQPARKATKTNSSIHRAFLDLSPKNPKKMSGIGEERARSNPVECGTHWLLLVALIVMLVLSGALPESVEGAKLQPHPFGRPEQANEREALNPFCGATATVNDPVVPWAMVKVVLESVSP